MVDRFAHWFYEEFGSWPHYTEEHAILLVVFCQENCDVSVGVVSGYISAWRDLLISNGASIPSRKARPWPLLGKILKGYKRTIGKPKTTRVPVSLINGKFAVIMRYYSSANAEAAERDHRRREPRFRYNWQLYRRTMRLTWLFAHKCLLRPDEYSMKSKRGADRMPKWEAVEFTNDGDMFYTKPSAKNDQFGEFSQPIPVCCECPGHCLPCELQTYKALLARSFGSATVAPSEFILKLSPGRTVGNSRLYREWALLRTTFGWDARHQIYSIRIGRCQDLYALGVEPSDIKKLGCWRSNTFERYLKTSKEDLRIMLRAKTHGISREVALQRMVSEANLRMRALTLTT